jgi:hypothetical protein
VFVATPDFVPDDLVHPASALSNTQISVSYLSINQGVGKVANRAQKDKIYFSEDQSLDPSDILVRTNHYHTVISNAGDTIPRISPVGVPEYASGEYYVIVHVDAENMIYEHEGESNNIIVGETPINVFLTPWPDLKPQNIVVADTVTAGTVIPLSYEILNDGTGEADGLGKEGIYYSFSPVWIPMFAKKLVTLTNETELGANEVYVNDYSVGLPSAITSNVYYFYIWTDEEQTVFENGNDANNILRSDPVFIHGYPPVDLVADTIHSALDTISSGHSFFPTWVVRNGGNGNLISNNWVDKAWLSADSILDVSIDIPMGMTNITASGMLPGVEMTVQKHFVVPNGTMGDYYVILMVDANDQNVDVDRENNIALLRNAAGVARRIHVRLSPSADLRPASFNAPGVVIAGHPFALSWETENAGFGNAPFWVERAYLSTDSEISIGDYLLLSRNEHGLPGGSSRFTDTTVFLPHWANGNYVLILQLDAFNSVYEHQAEGNNRILRSIEVTTPPPSDLFVTNVEVPASVIAGESATISWNTTNQGAYSAYGQLREIIYLSADPVLDVDDDLFAIRDTAVYIGPQGNRPRSHTGSVLGVEVGDYYALVQTDARDNMNESNEENNTTSSIDVMNVDVKRLYLDSLTMDTLINASELYYKVVIPSTYEGYNLLVRVQGDTLNSAIELYARYGMVPSRAEFDYAFDRPFDSYQEFVVRNLLPGTYYIMAYGRHDSMSTQPVKLYARVVAYSLTSVSPPRGGNEGFVTLTLKGSSLDSTNEVRLVDTSFNYVIADTFVVINDGLIVARFDLRGVTPGVYTVQSTKPDDNLGELVDAFTVIDGGSPDLQVVYTYAPASFFVNTSVTKLIVEGINNGDNDVENMSFLIESPIGTQLAHSFADHQMGLHVDDITVPVGMSTGFQNVLAPGQTIRYEIPMTTSPYPLASISIVENE